MATSTTRPGIPAGRDPRSLEPPPAPPARTGPAAPAGWAARARGARDAAPGLVACGVAVLASWGVHRLAGAVPMLTAALVLGIVAVNAGVLPEATRAGARFAASTMMRAGVALLGLQVALADVAGLGWQTIVMAVAVLLATLFGTAWLGRRMGLPKRMSLLVAAGFAICGASAVAAVDGVLGPRAPGGRGPAGANGTASREDDDRASNDRASNHHETDRHEGDAATAVALVTLCGTLAIAVMPAAGHLLGLPPYDLGRWIGASVHDVGQVVATATVVGPAALVPAVAVKLIRVAMLAPVTAVIALRVRRGAGHTAGVRRPPVVPVFLAVFLVMVAVRSTGLVPPRVLETASTVKDLLFAAALFGLGTAVRVGPLIRTGRRALLLGLTSWVLIAAISYAGVLLTR